MLTRPLRSNTKEKEKKKHTKKKLVFFLYHSLGSEDQGSGRSERATTNRNAGRGEEFGPKVYEVQVLKKMVEWRGKKWALCFELNSRDGKV